MTTNRIDRANHNHTARNGHDAEQPVTPAEQPAHTAEPDLPPLSPEDRVALTSARANQQVLRTLTIGCIDGYHPGAVIHGPPGVGKSHTILSTVREKNANWKLHQRITSKPLFFALERDPGAVHLIEDCEQLFSEPSAQTLLRSALGGERVHGRRERKVCYSVSGSHARELPPFYFYGSVIFALNRPLAHEKPEIDGVLSRLPCVRYTCTDQEIRAIMRDAARKGYATEKGSMTPHECVEVVEYVITQASELGCRLDLRWIEHGYAHYLTQAEGGGGVDWRDMVKFHLMQALTRFDYEPPTTDSHLPHEVTTRQADKAGLVCIAQEIAKVDGLSHDERLRRWEARTRKSRATYYRSLKRGLSNPASG